MIDKGSQKILSVVGLVLVGLAIGKRVLTHEVSVEQFNNASSGDYVISGTINNIISSLDSNYETKVCISIKDKENNISDPVCMIAANVQRLKDRLSFGARVKAKINRSGMSILDLDVLDKATQDLREAVATGNVRSWNGYAELEVKMITPFGEGDITWAAFGQRFTAKKNTKLVVDKSGRAWKVK